MTVVKCFKCDKVIKPEYIKKKIRCPYCGSKILFKPRVVSKEVEAV
jgi:DNA-directed RNA polymerase subunit RPC12/RpoP